MFMCETQDFIIVEDMIPSVDSPSGHQPKCLFNVSLVYTDLN
jgi:hypothetical protein